jgi:hypothetical protein
LHEAVLKTDRNTHLPWTRIGGAGQFGNTGDKSIYAKVLHPLIGSLVSFFHDLGDYEATSSKGQQKFGLVDLQHHLTGRREDVRAIAPKGIAAQQGRLGHDNYAGVMTASYYESVNPAGTGFTGGDEGALRQSGVHRTSPLSLINFRSSRRLPLNSLQGNRGQE